VKFLALGMFVGTAWTQDCRSLHRHGKLKLRALLLQLAKVQEEIDK